MNPIEFYAAISSGVADPMMRLISYLLPPVIIALFIWGLISRTLVGRPDQLFAVATRTLLIAILIWAVPLGARILDSTWALAWTAGNGFVKERFDDLLDRYGGVFEASGALLTGGALAVKAAATQALKHSAKRTLDNLARNIAEEVAKEGAEKGWAREKILEETAKRIDAKIKSDPTLKELAQTAGPPNTGKIKTLVNGVNNAARYANLIGLALVPLLWLFVILGLATGLTVNLTKIALPIALAILAISPRSGVMYFQRTVNIALSALAAAYLIPVVVAVSAGYFLGTPAQAAIDAIEGVKEQFEYVKSLPWYEKIGEFYALVGTAISAFVTFLASTLKLLFGLLLLYILGAIAATVVPYTIGQVLTATGLLETVLLGRGAVSLLNPRVSMPNNQPYRPQPPAPAVAPPAPPQEPGALPRPDGKTAPPALPRGGGAGPLVGYNDFPGGPPMPAPFAVRLFQQELPSTPKKALPPPNRALPGPKR